MPLPVVVDDSDLLAALTDDIAAAWGVLEARIFPDFPEFAAGKPDLPRALAALGEVAFDGLTTTLDAPAEAFAYTLIGQFLKPTTGTLREAKIERINALLALLTADPQYHGYLWRLQRVLPGVNPEAEARDGYYTVQIDVLFEANCDTL